MSTNIQQTPREAELLKILAGLEELVEMTAQKIATLEQALSAREEEITQLRRSAVELQQENQRQKEIMQTWRERVSSVLGQICDLR